MAGKKNQSTREIEDSQLGREPTEAELAAIVPEGMSVRATARPVDPDDFGDVMSSNDPRNFDDEGAGFDPGAAGEGAAVPTDLTTRLTEALEALAARQGTAQGPDPITLGILSTLTAAVDRLSQGQLQGAQIIAQATRKASRPSNEAPPKISVLNPRGDKDFPKPPLKCMMLLPWEAEWESLDREEIELLNLLEPGDYVVVRNDRTKIKMMVRCEFKLDSDVPSKLIMNHDTAFNNDYHRMMPPLIDMLRGMLKQNPKTRAKAEMVLTMDEELALIEAGKLNDGSVPVSGQVVSVGE